MSASVNARAFCVFRVFSGSKRQSLRRKFNHGRHRRHGTSLRSHASAVRNGDRFRYVDLRSRYWLPSFGISARTELIYGKSCFFRLTTLFKMKRCESFFGYEMC